MTLHHMPVMMKYETLLMIDGLFTDIIQEMRKNMLTVNGIQLRNNKYTYFCIFDELILQK